MEENENLGTNESSEEAAEQLNNEVPETASAEPAEQTQTAPEVPEVEVVQPKKRKYGWVGYVLLVAVICLSVWMMLEIVMVDADEYKSFGELIAASDWRFALISLAVLLVTLICIALEYVVIIKAVTGKANLRAGIKVAFLGKFYDNVTPFSTGGQPMQIYYLHKKGYSGGVSSAVVLIKYFVWMICWLLVSLLLMACNVGVLDKLDHTYKVLLLSLGWVGLGINLLLPLMVLLFVVLPKLANKLASGIVGVGAKIRIVKDKEKTLGKAKKVVSDFRNSFAIMSRRPALFILLVAMCLVEVFLSFAFPYFIMRAYSGITTEGIETMFAVAALNTYVILGVALIPTPGNTGAMEGVGALAFSAFVTGSVQFWSMFTWRFAVYYIYIIIGLGITVFEFIRKIVRSRRQKKKEQAEEAAKPE
ncbi:MAG: flippase-like domain-containing protein [Clostridia bacterium]|nr:flippase-like domain-containing protein [Clostridia bacterium]